MRVFNLNDLKRKGNFRHQNKVVLITTNGKITEKIYFSKFKKENSKITVEVRTDGGSDPITLIKFSTRIKESYDTDRIYCVFDVNGTVEEDLIRAKKMASKHGMITCISNPCFEVWYLLHFDFSTCTLSNYDEVEKELLKHIKDYSKTKDVFEILQPNQHRAISHAQKLDQHHKISDNTTIRMCNPSTQVYAVVEYLNKLV